MLKAVELLSETLERLDTLADDRKAASHAAVTCELMLSREKIRAALATERARQMRLGYDPSDPDKMNLPAGVTCGDCFHIARCKALFGHVETDTRCDWAPSRFTANPCATKAAR